MIIEITEEVLQKAIEDAFNKLISADNYNNPILELVKRQVGSDYNKGTLTEEINKKITTKVEEILVSPIFNAQLGEQIAKAIAQREIKAKER